MQNLNTTNPMTRTVQAVAIATMMVILALMHTPSSVGASMIAPTISVTNVSDVAIVELYILPVGDVDQYDENADLLWGKEYLFMQPDVTVTATLRSSFSGYNVYAWIVDAPYDLALLKNVQINDGDVFHIDWGQLTLVGSHNPFDAQQSCTVYDWRSNCNS